MIKNLGLAGKLILFILTSTTLVFAAAFGYNHLVARRIVLKGVRETTMNLTRATAYRIESVLRSVEQMPRNLAATLEEHPYTRADILRDVKDVAKNNPNIFGSAIAFEPYAFEPQQRYFAPYAYQKGNDIALAYLNVEPYHYFYMDWYQVPRELGHAVWSEPYYDEGGGDIMMATFSVPFYRNQNGKRTLTGIVTADVALNWLQEIIAATKVYTSGYAFLISANGVIITHPYQKFVMRESIFSIAEARGDKNLREIGRRMIYGDEDFVPITDFVSGEKAWLSYAPLATSGWSLAVVVPEKELFADVNTLSVKVVLIGAIGFLGLFIIIAFISRRITKPIASLAATTTEIARGNLDVELPRVTDNDEVGRLTRSFANMRTALKEYIADLAATTAAKERIESELKIARSIQLNFLPKQFPPFPDKTSFEIFATLESAKEVGGDLYDFFLLDDAHLLFTVGDVSGKGVPAALFMAVTKTLMKGMAEPGMPPSRLLELVNQELARDNDAMMFVTLFCGILDLRTGVLAYANAGHNPPVIIRRQQPPQWLEMKPGFVLGGMEDTEYETASLTLLPGDAMLVYTDGVTEAKDMADELYSDDRLLATARDFATLGCEAQVQKVLASVKAFAGEAPQADDITILSLHYLGGE